MIRNITISPVLNGFNVKVGCQSLVFTSTSHMLSELDRYLNSPESVEKEYLKDSLNTDKLDRGLIAPSDIGREDSCRNEACCDSPAKSPYPHPTR